ncbi:MAG: hypothetical protein QXV17_15020 [Candidatus Micrarchaeaceae archaeon]
MPKKENELESIQLGDIIILLPKKKMKQIKKLVEFVGVFLPLLIDSGKQFLEEFMADDDE